ncbi:AraC family transcriptional regulator [Pedobacter sp. GSP4]|uniref:AraC family transcriptional regulator n=1 Tax=Pedobacter sp. GSP4 TaxID=3453716 RepID=UPI003EEC057F
MAAIPHFPTLNINEFSDQQRSGNSLLYHSLTGERHIEKPHKHDFFLFMLFERGSGSHTIDFTAHPVAAMQLHMLFPGQIHQWQLGADTQAHQIMINRQVFETLASSLRFSLMLYQNYPVINLSAGIFKLVLYEFEQISTELAAPTGLTEIVNNRIKLIALLISKEAEILFNNQTVYQSKPILLKYLALIDAHYRHEKLVSYYANQLNISANYLNILCKRHFNSSATALIHERLILETKRMLLTTEHPIKSIAFELGFYDIAYFSKFFKKHTHLTPNQFRAQ